MAYTFISRILDFNPIFYLFLKTILMLRFLISVILFLSATKSQSFYFGDSLIKEGVHAFYNYDFNNSVEILTEAKKNILITPVYILFGLHQDGSGLKHMTLLKKHTGC